MKPTLNADDILLVGDVSVRGEFEIFRFELLRLEGEQVVQRTAQLTHHSSLHLSSRHFLPRRYRVDVVQNLKKIQIIEIFSW